MVEDWETVKFESDAKSQDPELSFVTWFVPFYIDIKSGILLKMRVLTVCVEFPRRCRDTMKVP